MSRRRTSSLPEPSSASSASATMHEARAYPFSTMQRKGQAQNQIQHQQGPIEGPGGRRLVRRVTWRSSSYKIMASLWVLGMVYIVWLMRYLFSAPIPSPTPSPGPKPRSVGAGG